MKNAILMILAAVILAGCAATSSNRQAGTASAAAMPNHGMEHEKGATTLLRLAR